MIPRSRHSLCHGIVTGPDAGHSVPVFSQGRKGCPCAGHITKTEEIFCAGIAGAQRLRSRIRVFAKPLIQGNGLIYIGKGFLRRFAGTRQQHTSLGIAHGLQARRSIRIRSQGRIFFRRSVVIPGVKQRRRPLVLAAGDHLRAVPVIGNLAEAVNGLLIIAAGIGVHGRVVGAVHQEGGRIGVFLRQLGQQLRRIGIAQLLHGDLSRFVGRQLPLLVCVLVAGDLGEQLRRTGIIQNLHRQAGRAVEALARLLGSVLVSAGKVEFLRRCLYIAKGAQGHTLIIMIAADQVIRISVTGHLRKQRQAGFGVAAFKCLLAGQINSVQRLVRAVGIVPQGLEGRHGRIPASGIQQRAGTAVFDLRQAGRSLAVAAQGLIGSLRLVQASVSQLHFRHAPAAAQGLVRAVGIVPQGLENHAGFHQLRFGDGIAADHITGGQVPAFVHTGGCISVIPGGQAGKALLSRIIVLLQQGALCQLVLHIGDAMKRKASHHRQQYRRSQDDSQPPPPVPSTAVNRVLLFSFRTGESIFQRLPADLLQLALTGTGNLGNGLPTEAAEDVILPLMAAQAGIRAHFIGSSADAQPQLALLHGISAGSGARRHTQIRQRLGASEIVRLVLGQILLFVPPNRAVIIPNAFDKNIIASSADMRPNRYRHAEGAARRAVEHPAPMGDEPQLLARFGQQAQTHLHRGYLLGGQIEQRHLADIAVILRHCHAPCLHRTGQVDLHHRLTP